MTKFLYGKIYVGRVSGTSGIFYGQNQQTKVVSHKKVNDGVGRSYGEGNKLENNRAVINDEDLLDTFFHNIKVDN
jgi:hypothetical protein